MMSGSGTPKNLQTKFHRKAIVNNFFRERQYERLEGQEGWRLSTTKMNSEKKHQQEVERMAESEIVPNRHVSVSIFGGEIENKVDKYSQMGYFSSTFTYFKFLFSTTNTNFKKPLAGGGSRG